MSDLSATNCGGGCSCNEGNGSSCWLTRLPSKYYESSGVFDCYISALYTSVS